jgi:hypothetical protein
MNNEVSSLNDAELEAVLDARELLIEELDKAAGGMDVTIKTVTAAVEIEGTGGILSGSAMGALVKTVIAAISDAAALAARRQA